MVGQTISHYRIVEKLGEGGMGVVYKAEDLKLGRAVALKFLPSHLMESEEHKARFLHEARAAALLDHPNICTVHEIDEANGQTFLAMACLEGQTLKQKIGLRPLPLAEALDIAMQIGHGLQAAHEKGIVHRDIKPANIMITPQGQVKIMDFGLAQLSDRTKLTASGMKLGTPAYMSPEQTEGKLADRRGDIWSLGVVLYEMISGRVPFPGEAEAAVAYAIVHTEPEPLTALRSGIPMEFDRILAKALAKGLADRYQHVDDLMVDLRRAHQRGQSPASSRRSFSRRAKVAAVAAVAAGVALAALGAWALLRQEQPGPPQRVTHFAIVLPAAHRITLPENDRELVLSPDGRYIAFRVSGTWGGGRLAVRALDRMDVHLFSDITAARSPFFSPDSRWIGFSESGQLKKVSVAGGAPIVIGNNLGGDSASWADDNTIVYARGGRLLAVSANGGEPTLLAAPDGEDEYTLPSALPGRRGILFTIRQRSPFIAGKARRSVADPNNVQVAVLDLATGRHKTLIRGGTAAEYARSGHLLYAIAGTLFAARFDPTRLEMLGEPAPVVQDLQMALNAGAASYSVSHEGTLVYLPNTSGRRSIVWVDRNGAETPVPAPPRAYHHLNLSPDGARAVIEIREEQDIFVWDFRQETLARLTFDPNMDCLPHWTPDGRRVLFTSTRDGLANLYAQTADGAGAVQRLTTSDTAQFVNSVTPDGDVLGVQWSPKSGYDIVLFPLAGLVPRAGAVSAPGTKSSIARPLVQTPSTDYGAVISPDSRFFAYISYESGRKEIYVRPFPGASEGLWQVSINGGTSPIWAPSGKELFYLSRENALMSVAVQPGMTTFRAGTPTKLLEAKYSVPGDFGSYDVSPDGRRFLMLSETDVSEPTAAPANMIVVLNWFEELRSRDQD